MSDPAFLLAPIPLRSSGNYGDANESLRRGKQLAQRGKRAPDDDKENWANSVREPSADEQNGETCDTYRNLYLIAEEELQQIFGGGFDLTHEQGLADGPPRNRAVVTKRSARPLAASFVGMDEDEDPSREDVDTEYDVDIVEELNDILAPRLGSSPSVPLEGEEGEPVWIPRLCDGFHFNDDSSGFAEHHVFSPPCRCSNPITQNEIFWSPEEILSVAPVPLDTRLPSPFPGSAEPSATASSPPPPPASLRSRNRSYSEPPVYRAEIQCV